MTIYQEKALRRLAAPMLSAKGGLPLIKSTASLGRRLEWRRGISTVEEEMPDGVRKARVHEDFEKFVRWMQAEDGSHYRGEVRIEGPLPHVEYGPNHVQVGDRGGKREIARNAANDTFGNGKLDYIIWCLFDVPEMVTEIPTDLAVDLFGKGRPGIRPLREREWRNEGASWSQRN